LNGFIFKGNVTNRKMMTNFNSPRVLLFANSLDSISDADMDIFFYENLKNKKNVTYLIIER
jgi:hypothetical protein